MLYNVSGDNTILRREICRVFFVQEPIQEYKDLLNRVKNAIPVLKDLKDNEILYKDIQLDSFINFDPSEYSGNLHLSEAFRNGTPTGSDIHRLVHLQLRDTDLPFILTKQYCQYCH